MTAILSFVRPAHDIEQIRSEYNLTRAQLADALDVSPATVEAWETGRRRITRNLCEIRQILDSRRTGIPRAQNLIFGLYRLSIAKELLQMSPADCARLFSMSPQRWSEYERNKRVIEPSVMRAIEEKIRDQFRCFEQ